ncbi:MAG: hypothetical protein ACFFD5_15295 [Candidatus Thorarchaeota archaeon]
MIKCPVCGKEIKHENLNKAFKISLGNLLDGKFYVSKSLFYHTDCLVNDQYCEEQLQAQFI